MKCDLLIKMVLYVGTLLLVAFTTSYDSGISSTMIFSYPIAFCY